MRNYVIWGIQFTERINKICEFFNVMLNWYSRWSQVWLPVALKADSQEAGAGVRKKLFIQKLAACEDEGLLFQRPS